jgi:hypothetical protein
MKKSSLWLQQRMFHVSSMRFSGGIFKKFLVCVFESISIDMFKSKIRYENFKQLLNDSAREDSSVSPTLGGKFNPVEFVPDAPSLKIDVSVCMGKLLKPAIKQSVNQLARSHPLGSQFLTFHNSNGSRLVGLNPLSFRVPNNLLEIDHKINENYLKNLDSFDGDNHNNAADAHDNAVLQTYKNLTDAELKEYMSYGIAVGVENPSPQ